MSGDSVTKSVGRTRINVRLDVVALLLLASAAGGGSIVATCVTTFRESQIVGVSLVKIFRKIVPTKF